MTTRKIVVDHRTGFHFKSAVDLARVAEKCQSKVEIRYKYKTVNAKSLLNIIGASIRGGSEIELTCTGPGEESDMEKILKVIEGK
jgi:phosphocarrier protein